MLEGLSPRPSVRFLRPGFDQFRFREQGFHLEEFAVRVEPECAADDGNGAVLQQCGSGFGDTVQVTAVAGFNLYQRSLRNGDGFGQCIDAAGAVVETLYGDDVFHGDVLPLLFKRYYQRVCLDFEGGTFYTNCTYRPRYLGTSHIGLLTGHRCLGFFSYAGISAVWLRPKDLAL